MTKDELSLTRKIWYEGFDRYHFGISPRHEEVPKTSLIDVRNLVIDSSSVGKKRELPSIKEMLDKDNECKKLVKRR